MASTCSYLSSLLLASTPVSDPDAFQIAERLDFMLRELSQGSHYAEVKTRAKLYLQNADLLLMLVKRRLHIY